MAINRANVSISELMDVLNKSGLPMAGMTPDQTAMMQQQQAQQAIGGTIRGQDKTIQAAKDKYMAQINQIASQDQKLSEVYSNPESQLYLEHPMDRERAMMGASDIGYQAAGIEAQGIGQAEQDVEETIDMAIDLYDQMRAELKRAKSGSGKKKAGTDAVEQALKQDGIELATTLGISDPEAQDFFLSQPTAFIDWYKRQWLRGGQSTTIDFDTLRQMHTEWAGKYGSGPEKKEAGIGEGGDSLTELAGLVKK